MDVYQAATSRRSIRRFKDIAIPYEILEKCVNAARLAPSAWNLQLCEYVTVNNDQLLAEVYDCITRWAGQPAAKGGPPPGSRPKAYIIVLINTALENELGGMRNVTIYDIGMAAENAMLVAQEQGVGTCPILSFKENGLKQALAIPDEYLAALVIALGYPDENPLQGDSTGVVKYWTDSEGVRHVPKRKLSRIMHHNKF